jgi:predicted TIM-barrel fold metal-dependent hydrolase
MKALFNPERMMWASDFPHLDSTYPHSQALLDEHTVLLTPHETDLLVHDNVTKLYGLNVKARTPVPA